MRLPVLEYAHSIVDCHGFYSEKVSMNGADALATELSLDVEESL